MKKLSVVIPIYNDEACIEPLFKQLKEVEQKLLSIHIFLQVICVDDGSKDNTFLTLKSKKNFFSDFIIVKLTRNFGAVCASNAGIKQVNGDCFTIYAADLQDPIPLIFEMAEKWKNGAKYIIAVRSKTRKDPFLTRLYAALYYKLITFFVVKDFPKTGFDIAFWDGSILEHLRNTSKNINRSLFSHWLGYKPEVIVYDRPERASGKSGWTLSKKLKLFIDSFLGFSVLPIRMISFIGLITSFLSFIYGIIIIIGAIRGTVTEPGFATITTLFSFLIGLVIIMLGIIGEYLWRIFDEVNKRPDSVIDEIY